MSILSRLFSDKQSVSKILINTQISILNIYGVARPTDAQKFRAYFYLCISGIAILNELEVKNGKNTIDKLAEETKELVKPLSLLVEELSSDAERLEIILAHFPDELQMTGSTKLNGLAALETLYSALGDEVITDIISNSEGPMGTRGYAAIIVADEIFGEGRSQDKFMEVSMQLNNFTNELCGVS